MKVISVYAASECYLCGCVNVGYIKVMDTYMFNVYHQQNTLDIMLNV